MSLMMNINWDEPKQCKPHTNHSYEKIAVPMYVCMYVYLYVCTCSDTSSTCSSCTMRVRISQFGEDRQRISHVNSNYSSPKQEKN